MEILNFEHNYKQIAIKALNKADTILEAAKLIGIEERQLYNWIKKYKIKRFYGEDVQGGRVAKKV
jgi:transposase-like protein